MSNKKEKETPKQNINNPKNEFTFEQRKSSIERVQVNDYGLLQKHADNSPVNNRPINISVSEQTPDQVRTPRPVNNDSVYVNSGNRYEARPDNNSNISNNRPREYRTDYIQPSQPYQTQQNTRVQSTNPYLNEHGMINTQSIQPQQPATPNNGSVVNTRAINLRPQQPAESASDADHREAMERDARTPYTQPAEAPAMGIPYVLVGAESVQPVRARAATPYSDSSYSHSPSPRVSYNGYRPEPVNVNPAPSSYRGSSPHPYLNEHGMVNRPVPTNVSTPNNSTVYQGRPSKAYMDGHRPAPVNVGSPSPVSSGQRIQSTSPYLNERGIISRPSQPQVSTPNNNAVFQNRQSKISVNGQRQGGFDVGHQPQNIQYASRQATSPYLNERGMINKPAQSPVSTPNNQSVISSRPSKAVAGHQPGNVQVNGAARIQQGYTGQSTNPYMNNRGMVSRQPQNVGAGPNNNTVFQNRPSRITAGQQVGSAQVNGPAKIQQGVQHSTSPYLNSRGMVNAQTAPGASGTSQRVMNGRPSKIVQPNQIGTQSVNGAAKIQGSRVQTNTPYLNEKGMINKSTSGAKSATGNNGKVIVNADKNPNAAVNVNRAKAKVSGPSVLDEKGMVKKPGSVKVNAPSSKTTLIRNQVQPTEGIHNPKMAGQNSVSVNAAQNALKQNGINVHNLSNAELKRAIETGKLGQRKLSATDIQNLKTVQVAKTQGTIRHGKSAGDVKLLQSGANKSLNIGGQKFAAEGPNAKLLKTTAGKQAGTTKLVTDTNLKMSKTGTIKGTNVPKPALKHSLDKTKKLSVNKETIKPELLQKINTKEKNILGKNIKSDKSIGLKTKASTQHLNAQAKVNVVGKKSVLAKKSGEKTLLKTNNFGKRINTGSIFAKSLGKKKIGFFGKRTPTELVSGGVSVLMGVTMGVGALGPYATATSNQPYISYYNLKGTNLSGEDSEDTSTLGGLTDFDDDERDSDWQGLLTAVANNEYDTNYSGQSAQDDKKNVAQWLVDDMYEIIEDDIGDLEKVSRKEITENEQPIGAELDGYEIPLDLLGNERDTVMSFKTHYVYVGIPDNPANAPNNIPETASSISPGQNMPNTISTSSAGYKSYKFVESRGTVPITVRFESQAGNTTRIYYADSSGNQYLGINQSSYMYRYRVNGKYLAGWSLTEGSTKPDFITYQKLDAIDLAKLKAAASSAENGRVTLYAVYLDNKTCVKLDTLEVISDDEITPRYSLGGDYTTDEELSGYFTDKERSVQYHFTDGFGGDAYFSEDDGSFGYSYNINALFKTLLCMVVLASENSDALTNKNDATKVSDSLHDYCEEILKLALEPEGGRPFSVRFESRALPGTKNNNEYREAWSANGAHYQADTARMLAIITIDVDISIETLTTKDEEGNEGNGIYTKYFRDDNGNFKNASETREYTFKGWTDENKEYCVTYTEYQDDDFRSMFNIVFPPVSEYASMSGDDNAAKIFNHIVNRGYSVASALAMLGNLRVECPLGSDEDGDIDDHYEVTRTDGITYVSFAKVPINEFNDYFASSGKQWGDESLTIEDQTDFYLYKLGQRWLPKVTTANFFDQIGAWLGIGASQEKTEESKNAEDCVNTYIGYYSNTTYMAGTKKSEGAKPNKDYKGDALTIYEDFKEKAKNKNSPEKVVEEYLWITLPDFQSMSDIERATRALCVSFYALYKDDGVDLLKMLSSKCEKRVKFAVEYNDRVEYGVGGQSAFLYWLKKIADDDTHGYGNPNYAIWEPGVPHSLSNAGDPDFDCGSYISYCLWKAQIVPSFPCYEPGTDEVLTSFGFTQMEFESVEKLKPGDILIRWSDESACWSHTEAYVGEGKTAGAHEDTDCAIGDSGGNEIDYGVSDVGNRFHRVYRNPKCQGSLSVGIEAEKILEELGKIEMPTYDVLINELKRKHGLTEEAAIVALGWAVNEGLFEDPYLEYCGACCPINYAIANGSDKMVQWYCSWNGYSYSLYYNMAHTQTDAYKYMYLAINNLETRAMGCHGVVKENGYNTSDSIENAWYKTKIHGDMPGGYGWYGVF